MDGVFHGWRRKFGLAALCAALFFIGAWWISLYDQVVHRGQVQDQILEVCFAGKIVITGYTLEIERPGHRPQTHWRIKGLYTDARISHAPIQVTPPVPEPAASAPQNPVPPAPREEITAAGGDVILTNHSDQGVADDGAVMQAAASKTPLALLVKSDSQLDIDDELEEAQFDTTYDETARIATRWQWLGMRRLLVQSAEGASDGYLLIPHWFLIGPLLLLSGCLLFRTRKGDVQEAAVIPAEAAPVQKAGTPWIKSTRRIFQGWRGKLGLATVALTLVFMTGWARSLAVSERVSWVIGPPTRLLVYSGKYGLSFAQDSNADECSKSHYWKLPDRDYEHQYGRPSGWNMDLPDVFVVNADGTPWEGSIEAPPRDVVIPTAAEVNPTHAASTVLHASEETESEVPDSKDLEQDGNTQATNPKLGQIVGLQRIETAEGLHTVKDEYAGGDFDWCGLYCSVSYNPWRWNVVIPYQYFVVPLMLISAMLLVRPRVATPKFV